MFSSNLKKSVRFCILWNNRPKMQCIILALPVFTGDFTLFTQVGTHSPINTASPKMARFLDEDMLVTWTKTLKYVQANKFKYQTNTCYTFSWNPMYQKSCSSACTEVLRVFDSKRSMCFRDNKLQYRNWNRLCKSFIWAPKTLFTYLHISCNLRTPSITLH